jgi:hypothetical protein
MYWNNRNNFQRQTLSQLRRKHSRQDHLRRWDPSIAVIDPLMQIDSQVHRWVSFFERVDTEELRHIEHSDLHPVWGN